MLANNSSGVGHIDTGRILKLETNPRTSYGVTSGHFIVGQSTSNTIIFDQSSSIQIGGSTGFLDYHKSQREITAAKHAWEVIQAKNNPPLKPTELSQNPATRSRWRWALPDNFFVSKKRQYVDQVMRPAIYVLYQGAEVVYVGQSSNVFSRLATHKKEAKKEFDSFRILYCRHNRMTYWERRLIKKYEPKYNISQNRRKAKELGYKTPAQRRKESGEW